MVAGVHPACLELPAREAIRSVLDLKGKKVWGARIWDSSHTTLGERWARSSQRPQLGLRLHARSEGPFPRRRDRGVNDEPALGAGTAPPECRPSHAQQRARPVRSLSILAAC
jgi:hypothetical protein